MRVNVYAEEMTDRVEIVTKETKDGLFTGVRFYTELPVTLPPALQAATGLGEVAGPFIHHPGDDDSAAITFWGKQHLRQVLMKALALLDEHEAQQAQKAKATDAANDVSAGALAIHLSAQGGFAGGFGPGEGRD